jgi:hypothetical protein
MNSYHFAFWLAKQPKPGILPNQSKALTLIMDRATSADLISVLYNGDDSLAVKALRELQVRFLEEMNALEERIRREDAYADPWN